MPDSNEKASISIYRIDKDLFDDLDDSEIIRKIITDNNSGALEDEKFVPQVISDSGLRDRVRIFHSVKERPPKWAPFLGSVLEESSSLLEGKNRDSSFIGFITDSDNLYAISGGQGNFVIQNYIDQNFGIDIITRLISKDSSAVKSLRDRDVAGSILGSERFFRKDSRLSDEDSFGKFYRQIQAVLEKDKLVDEFGFSTDLSKGSTCVAKSSFKINKSIDFSDLLRIIKNLSEILTSEGFSLNDVIPIVGGKKNRELISHLDEVILKKLYQYCVDHSVIDFDLCHRDFEKYLTASEYKVSVGKKEASYEDVPSVSLILDNLINGGLLNIKDIDSFRETLSKVHIQSFDSDGRLLTKGHFLKHINGEITYNKKTYFLIDKLWYEIGSNFIVSLNSELESLISNYLDNSILGNRFDVSRGENDFNESFLGEDGYIVMHRVLVENIEMCDLLKWDEGEGNIYLIHVKRGFDNSIRDLASQVAISSSRILNDIKSNKSSFIDNIQDKITSYSKDDPYFLSLREQKLPPSLKDVLKKNKFDKIHFCLAFVDDAKKEREISDIESFDSNIAKFSIIDLKKKINSMGFGFKVIQIKQK